MKTPNTTEITIPQKKKLFGGGYRKPIVDEDGNKWCNCLIPNLTSHQGLGKGQAHCMRCKCDWYH